MRRNLFEEEHSLFRETARHYVEQHVLPAMDDLIAQRAISRELWLEAGRMGFLGLAVPEEYGGGDPGDFRYSAMLTEELAKASLAIASSMSIHYDIVAPYLVELTTPEQRERWLPGFVTGEIVTAIAMTEPGGGSDLAGLSTSAKRVDGGWVLNGSKTFITNGFSADLIVVAAKTSPEKRAKGISLFVVENGMPGLSRGSKLDKIGQPEADTAELFFNELFVPDENVLGEIDRGFGYMMTFLAQERIAAGILNTAHARAVFEETLTYAKDRTAFGQPIGSFQHNKFTLADMATQLDVTQAFVDSCILAHNAGELTAVDAAKAKWWSADIQNKVLDNCLQLHGGYGYMREYRVGRAWVDARVTRIWAGSNEIMKELIGRDLGL